MEERHPREREMVLAPNEYAYVLDTTKGHVNCYVGPNKTSLAQTDQPVRFNSHSKRFESVDLERTIQLFATAPTNWYVVLKNPARDSSHPKAGTSNASVDLQVGAKINVHGPVSFPLWPGQMAKVIKGHRLRKNEYLYLQIYDPEQAMSHGRGAAKRSDSEEEEPSKRLSIGEKLIIRGTEMSFYIPPTGAEVLPDEGGAYVREAVTLERLEYCVLVGEDGRKRYMRGEAVVFPDPEQGFLERNGRRKFKAIELDEITGIYVKVTAPYTDEDGVKHREGEELFISGKDKIYFPREEHAVIRYGKHERHQAIAIPRGEGRYVLERLSGEVRLIEGPRMFLPDPRTEVVTRRILSDREVHLLYPHNKEALHHNRGLRHATSGAPIRPSKETTEAPDPRLPGQGREDPLETDQFAGDDFARTTHWNQPRTVTLDTKFDGAVTVDIWSGYAVQVVDRGRGRRVVLGPDRVILAYDETLEALTLSSGRPKGNTTPRSTVFLRVAANNVTDEIEIVSADMVKARLTLKYRVTFEGNDPSRWFAVDDYVKLLSDHASSLMKAIARRTPIRTLRSDLTMLVRDQLLGSKVDGDARPGLRFSENGMRVFDVEVLDLVVLDEEINALLLEAQTSAIRSTITLAEKETALAIQRRVEEIDRALAEEGNATDRLRQRLKAELDQAKQELAQQRKEHARELLSLDRARELQDAELAAQVANRLRETHQADEADALAHKAQLQRLALEELQARVDGAVHQAQAFSPHLVEALNRLGDEQLLGALASNFAELAAVEGRGLLETAHKFLDFAPATLLPTLRDPGEDL